MAFLNWQSYGFISDIGIFKCGSYGLIVRPGIFKWGSYGLASCSAIGCEVSSHSSRSQHSAPLTRAPPHLRPTPRSDFLHKVVLIDVLVFQEGILTLLRFFSSYTTPSSLTPDSSLTTHFLHMDPCSETAMSCFHLALHQISQKHTFNMASLLRQILKNPI